MVEELTSRGIGFRSLTEGLHTEGPMGTATLTIMAAFAELERDTMIERTRAGLSLPQPTGARADAHVRSMTPMPPKACQLREKGITATDFAKMLEVSRRCLYTAASPMVRWLAR